ncbi:MAG: hypothetical protein BWK73_50380, partial [Thiothrix lacustris]
DVRSQGLMIFTAMDPIVQLTAETILQNRVGRLERAERIPKGKLNGALIISSVQGGEVMALVGSRDVRYAGYNRALTAQRQIGSLVKPAIYLAALENPRKYNLATRINDGPVTVKLGSKKYWQPQNYDHSNMGAVTLLKAIMLSRNTPAVRVGVGVGLDKVVQTLHDLGIGGDIPAFHSVGGAGNGSYRRAANVPKYCGWRFLFTLESDSQRYEPARSSAHALPTDGQASG